MQFSFNLACDNRGEPEYGHTSRGMSESIVLPTEFVQERKVRLTYAWNPSGDDIYKKSFVEAMRKDNFKRWIDSIPRYIQQYIPNADTFDGIIVIDLEEWSALLPNLDLDQESREMAAIDPFTDLVSPDVRRAAMHGTMFKTVTMAVESVAPYAQVGWYGVTELHSGFLGDDANYRDYFESNIAYASKWRGMLRMSGVPCPVFYFPSTLRSRDARIQSFDRRDRMAKTVWDANEIANCGTCLLDCRHQVTAPDDLKGRWYTPEETQEMVWFVVGRGYRHITWWEALRNQEDRDGLQRWLDDVLNPLLINVRAVMESGSK